jgi:hypothetical protein
MKNHFLLSLFALVILSCQQKTKINYDLLKTELDSILVLDQKYRPQIRTAYQKFGQDSPEFKEVLDKQNRIDSLNQVRVIEIIDEIGQYPGVSLVGVSASKTTFYVLQHAPDSIQEQYYELIIDAAKNNELSRGLAAMYQDRYLMYRGKSQIFGTQVRIKHKIDSITGEQIDSAYLWPIKDTVSIDSLRMWNGLGPLEEYLNAFGLSRTN